MPAKNQHTPETRQCALDGCTRPGRSNGRYKLCNVHYIAKWNATTQRPIPHGTEYGYTQRACRCPECTRAHADRVREWEAKRYG